jgi:hypothetical protein
VNRWLSALLLALVMAVGIVALVNAAGFLQHWIAIHSGSDFEMCGGSPCPVQPYYNWWSGPGSDLGEVTLITAILTPAIIAARHRNCATRGCWRLTDQVIEDDRSHVKYRRCHRHHPCIPNEHARHGILRHHMSDEHLAEIDAHHVEMNPPTTPPEEAAA